MGNPLPKEISEVAMGVERFNLDSHNQYAKTAENCVL